jgi:hypothetical protein
LNVTFQTDSGDIDTAAADGLLVELYMEGLGDVFGHGFTKQDGTRVINALNDGEMLGMMYYVKGIISKIPSG